MFPSIKPVSQWRPYFQHTKYGAMSERCSLLVLILGVHGGQLHDLVKGANDTVVTQVYLSRPYPPNGTYKPVHIYKKRKVHKRLAGRPKEIEAACVYRVMQKAPKRPLSDPTVRFTREYRPPSTHCKRVRKSEKEDESDQTSSALRKVLRLAICVYV
jgi:hypothetical protein